MLETNCGFNDTSETSGSILLAIYGPTINVDIGFDPTFKPVKNVIPVLWKKGIPALIDTGASESCIDNTLGSSLGLPIVDRGEISGVGGIHKTNIYLAQIHIPDLNFTIYGRFAGVDIRAGGQLHYALIGRNFLQNFTMIYNGKTGDVKLLSV